MPPEAEVDDQQDSLLPSREMAIRLPVFEGPLDLLLFLIRKNELDIYDIPIEQVTRQYLDVLRQMEALSLEVAGEFFVMASTLMYIKSRMLLPVNEQDSQPDEETEEADPRWELVEQLLEYKRFKEAAEQIRQAVERQQDFLPRLYKAGEEDRDPRPLKPSDRLEVWNMFNLVLRRLSEKIVQGEIHDEQVTVADRMEHVLHRLQTSRSFLFSELFEGEPITHSKLVATLLAILELTRLKHIVIQQEELFGDVRCDAREGDDIIPEGVELVQEGEEDEAEPELIAAEPDTHDEEDEAESPDDEADDFEADVEEDDFDQEDEEADSDGDEPLDDEDENRQA